MKKIFSLIVALFIVLQANNIITAEDKTKTSSFTIDQLDDKKVYGKLGNFEVTGALIKQEFAKSSEILEQKFIGHPEEFFYYFLLYSTIAEKAF